MTKRKPQPSQFLPDYCKLDRAARIIECEVSDLINWGAQGYVALFISFGMNGTSVRSGPCLVVDENYDDRINGGVNKLARYTVPPSTKDKAHVATWDGDKGYGFHLYGLWGLPSKATQQLEFESVVSAQWVGMTDERGRLVYACLGDKFGEGAPSVTHDDLWITRPEVERLLTHKREGTKPTQPDGSNTNQQLNDLSTDSKRSDAQRERHASNREKVLAAALFAVHQQGFEGYPFNGNATNIAQAIFVNEGSIFKDECGESPLKHDAMTRIISAAILRGETIAMTIRNED